MRNDAKYVILAMLILASAAYTSVVAVAQHNERAHQQQVAHQELIQRHNEIMSRFK